MRINRFTVVSIPRVSYCDKYDLACLSWWLNNAPSAYCSWCSGATGRASELWFIGHGFKSCLGTTTGSYLHLCHLSTSSIILYWPRDKRWFKHWVSLRWTTQSYVCGHDVQQMEWFVCLGAMIHSSCSSDPEIHRRCAMTRSAMQSLDWHRPRSCITTETKLHLYRIFILPIMPYGSECCAVNKANLQWNDALD